MPKKKKPPTPWEIAKPVLQQLHLDGVITNSMKIKDVWPVRPEFMAVRHNNFHNSFRRMKKTITADKERARIDEAGCLHDIAICSLAKDLEGYWDGSKAQELLKEDIRWQRHKRMQPKALWQSRPEHQEFSLSTFRGHIHQDLRSDRETNYWVVKKKKKERAELARKLGKKVNEEDADCFCDPRLATA